MRSWVVDVSREGQTTRQPLPEPLKGSVAVHLTNLKLTEIDPGYGMRDASQMEGTTLRLDQQLKQQAEASKLLLHTFSWGILKNRWVLLGSGQPSAGWGRRG